MRASSTWTETQALQPSYCEGGSNAEHQSKKGRRVEALDSLGQEESHTVLKQGWGRGAQVCVATLAVPETATEMWGKGCPRVMYKETVIETNQGERLAWFVTPSGTQDQQGTGLEYSLSFARTYEAYLGIYLVYYRLFGQACRALRRAQGCEGRRASTAGADL